MSDLRDRIAAAIESVGTIDGCCADLAAKAVIRDVLTPEFLADMVIAAVQKAAADE